MAGCPLEMLITVLRAATESVRIVICAVSEWALRAPMTPALSPTATEAFSPKYTALAGSTSPQLTAPWFVIVPPAAFPSQPEPSVNTNVAMGLASRIRLIQLILSSTFSCPGVRMTWRLTFVGLEGRLVLNESFWSRPATALTTLPMVVSAFASTMHLFMSGSGALTCLCTHWRWRFSRWTRIGSIPAMAHKLVPLLPW